MSGHRARIRKPDPQHCIEGKIHLYLIFSYTTFTSFPNFVYIHCYKLLGNAKRYKFAFCISLNLSCDTSKFSYFTFFFIEIDIITRDYKYNI